MAIELISKIKPKNNGRFPMVDASDVDLDGSARLTAVLAMDVNASNGFTPIKLLTQEQYDELLDNGSISTDRASFNYDPGTLYLIYEEDEA